MTKLTEQLTEQQRNFVTLAIFWDIAVKVAVAILVAVCAVTTDVPRDAKDQALTNPRALLFVSAFILLSAFLAVFYYFDISFKPSRREQDTDLVYPLNWVTFGITLKATVTEYPLLLLSLDFVGLAVLGGFTGGIASPFLPLSVVALILGDISVLPISKNLVGISRLPIVGRHREYLPSVFTWVRLMLVSSVLVGVYLPRQIDWVRNLLVNKGHSTIEQSVLVFSQDATILLTLFVFFASAIFGSIVIGSIRQKAERQRTGNV